MGIINSQIIEDSIQTDGRRWITERHTDHLGQFHTITYMADPEFDATAAMNNRVTSIENKLAESEAESSIARTEIGEDPLNMSFEFCTQKQAVKKIIRWAMNHKNPKTFLLLKNLYEYLKTNYNNSQLANFLDISLTVLGRINDRYNAIISIESTLTDDDGRIEEIE